MPNFLYCWILLLQATKRSGVSRHRKEGGGGGQNGYMARSNKHRKKVFTSRPPLLMNGSKQDTWTTFCLVTLFGGQGLGAPGQETLFPNIMQLCLDVCVCECVSVWMYVHVRVCYHFPIHEKAAGARLGTKQTNDIQWNLIITRSLGPCQITFLYQVSHYIRVKIQRNITELGPAKLPCYKRVLLYPTSL